MTKAFRELADERLSTVKLGEEPSLFTGEQVEILVNLRKG